MGVSTDPGQMQNTSMGVWVFSTATCLARKATAALLMPSLGVNFGNALIPPFTEDRNTIFVFSVFFSSMPCIFL